MKTTINPILRRGSLCLLLPLLFAVPAFAQDCNSIYENALELQKKRTEAAVREAIRKFESAKRCYIVNRNEESARSCDEQIALCNKVLNNYTPQEANVSEESFEFPAAGGEHLFPVKSKGNWSFSDNHDWCTLSKEKGALKITVGPNHSTVRRLQSITLKVGNKKQLIKIVQEGIEEKLALSEYDLYFESDGAEKSVGIESNLEWTVEKDNAPWCTWKKDSMHLYIEPSVNDEAVVRTGTIRIQAGSRRAEIRLSQGIDNFNIYTPQKNDTLIFIPKGGSIELPVEYTINPNSAKWEVYSYPNWCVASRKNDTSLSLKCEANKLKDLRTGTIQIKKGRRVVTLVVVQEEKSGKGVFSQGIFSKKSRLSLYQKAVLYTTPD